MNTGNPPEVFLTLDTQKQTTVIDPCGAGQNFRHATIEMLPEDTLLEIFDFYRLDVQHGELPWKWQRLAHV